MSCEVDEGSLSWNCNQVSLGVTAAMLGYPREVFLQSWSIPH